MSNFCLCLSLLSYINQNCSMYILSLTPLFLLVKVSTLLIFSLQKLQVFTVSQIPLQFHCIFYRQPTVNIFLQFLHSIFALVVCKKCSETAVGLVTQWKPVLPLQILAVHNKKSWGLQLLHLQCISHSNWTMRKLLTLFLLFDSFWKE